MNSKNRQRLVQDAEIRAVVLHVLPDGLLVRRDRVHIAAVEHGILHAAVRETDDVPEGRDVIAAAQEDRLRLAGRLHRDGLARELAHRLDAALRADRHDLTARQIRPRPLIVVLSSRHGKAAPDAVDLSAVDQLGLFLPVDRGEFRAVAHAAERLLRDLDVQTGDVAVIVHVDIGRIGVAADGERRERAVGRRGRGAAGQQERRERRKKRRCAPKPFVWYHRSPCLLLSLFPCGRKYRMLSFSIHDFARRYNNIGR